MVLPVGPERALRPSSIDPFLRIPVVDGEH
jgi:hypothetical protein